MDVNNMIMIVKSFLEDVYKPQIMEALVKTDSYIIIDIQVMAKYSYELVEEAIDNPEEFLKGASYALGMIDTYKSGKVPSIRLTNIPSSEKLSIREIRTKNLGKLVCIEANIKNKTDVRPMTVTARYECPACGSVIPVLQIDSQIKEPKGCGCGRRGNFRLLSREMIDAQTITIEEDVSTIGEDTVPKRIAVLLQKDLTSIERNLDLLPPRSVRVIGIIKEKPIMLKNGVKSANSDLYIEANNIEIIEDNLQRIVFTDEDIQTLKELSQKRNLLSLLKKSVAPHISGYDYVKEACLLFLVKGVKRESDDKTIKTRDFFHILLIGDPGTGKSEFGKEIQNLSFKAKRAVGKGASGVGLTASAEMDELLKMRVLSAGMIPMCNGGHAVIDEVDKMNPEVQSHLLNVMEDGVINVNKSQTQGVLKSEVGIFMIANPKNGRFDPYNIGIDQIELPLPLITRFDLIFPIKDLPDPQKDEDLVDAIVSKHTDIQKTSERPIPFDILRKYLFYVSQHISPKLTSDAVLEIKKFCKDMRGASYSTTYSGGSLTKSKQPKSIGITGRQIESPIRLAQAYAKLRMSDEVSKEDAKKAITMIKNYLKEFAYDVDTGQVDVDKITTGISASERYRLTTIKRIIDSFGDSQCKLLPMEQIIAKAKEESINEEQVESAISKLKKSGDLFEPKPGYIQKV